MGVSDICYNCGREAPFRLFRDFDLGHFSDLMRHYCGSCEKDAQGVYIADKWTLAPIGTVLIIGENDVCR